MLTIRNKVLMIILSIIQALFILKKVNSMISFIKRILKIPRSFLKEKAKHCNISIKIPLVLSGLVYQLLSHVIVYTIIWVKHHWKTFNIILSNKYWGPLPNTKSKCWAPVTQQPIQFRKAQNWVPRSGRGPNTFQRYVR